MSGTPSFPVSAERAAEIAAIADDDIDTTDIPEADAAFFEKARLVMPVGATSPPRPTSRPA